MIRSGVHDPPLWHWHWSEPQLRMPWTVAESVINAMGYFLLEEVFRIDALLALTTMDTADGSICT